MPSPKTSIDLRDIYTKRTKQSLGKIIGIPGTYGVVSAIKSQPNRVVKIFLAPDLKRGRKEIAISINMGMKGISPKIYKAGLVGFHNSDVIFYMIMEKIDGDYKYMKLKEPKIYVKYEKKIEEQIHSLVEKLHSYDIIHGDLKDNNIAYKKMKNGPPKMFIIDFGLSLDPGMQIDTNKKFIKGFVKVLRELDFKVNTVINQGLSDFVEQLVKKEIYYNKTMNKTLKNITIKNILKELKKIQSKPHKQIYVPVQQNGPLRLSMGNRHWVVYDPLNAKTLHGKPSIKSSNVIKKRFFS